MNKQEGKLAAVTGMLFDREIPRKEQCIEDMFQISRSYTLEQKA
jgi:hypothetical protein